MKRIGVLVVCAIFGFTMAFAQAGFSVSTTVHDFGTIYEEDGNVSHEFVITNTGNAPLEITRATASCGCTTPDWTKTPIASGEKGKVKATYMTKGRPGKFEKTIQIFTNVQEPAYVVRIKGEVVKKAAVDMQAKQPEITQSDKQ